jgi:hypothetical protein
MSLRLPVPSSVPLASGRTRTGFTYDAASRQPPAACRARIHYTDAVVNRLTHGFTYTYDVVTYRVRQCHAPDWLVVEVRPIAGALQPVHGASDSLADFPPLVGSLLA